MVFGNILPVCCGGVPELADGPDLGSGAAMREGSSPSFPTNACNSSGGMSHFVAS